MTAPIIAKYHFHRDLRLYKSEALPLLKILLKKDLKVFTL